MRSGWLARRGAFRRHSTEQDKVPETLEKRVQLGEMMLRAEIARLHETFESRILLSERLAEAMSVKAAIYQSDHSAVLKSLSTSPESGTEFVMHSAESALVDRERDSAHNVSEAAENFEEVAASDATLSAYIGRLREIGGGVSANATIPRIFHFVYGIRDGGDLPYYGYMAIKSALYHNAGWKSYLHTMQTPTGPNWDRIKTLIEVVKVGDFTHYKTARVRHYAHKADIIRLLALAEIGGVYLDLDTITQRSFESLCDFEFVMGVQASAGDHAPSGLCNAVMLSRARSRFVVRWLDQYDYFRSQGRDDLWDYHSVKLPGILMAQNPEAITVLDYRAFFYPLWNTIEAQLFTNRGFEKFNKYLSNAYCFHLWHGATDGLLEKVDEKFVRTSGSIYAQIARRAEGLN